MTTLKECRDFADELFGQTKLDDAIEWISSNLNLEEVFDSRALEAWAEEHGYVLEE